jgi:hypothetical protein
MYGGLRGRANFALVLGAGLLVTAAVPAAAADLGTDGVADLEERIAELEATTARKGNRKVTLTISGYVNEQVQWWDDGVEQNAYVGTNESDQTRLRFVGKAKINADFSAGYILELGFRGAAQGAYNANDDEGSGAGVVSLRHSAWYLESKTFGKVTVGRTSAANDSITELTTAKTITVEKPIQIFTPNAGFAVRRGIGSAGINWGQLSSIPQAGEGDRYDVVRYDTPEFKGFVATASWGEDDLWAVALRYSAEVHGFKLAGGIGYSEITDAERGLVNLGGQSAVSGTEFGLSVSALHIETGLFATFAYGEGKDENRHLVAVGGDTDEGWNIQAGIQKKFNPLGNTTVFGEYYQGDYGAAVAASPTGGAWQRTIGGGFSNVSADRITGSEVDVWGIAAVQAIDAAALELYISYRHYGVDITTVGAPNGVTGLEDFQTVFSGAKISF